MNIRLFTEWLGTRLKTKRLNPEASYGGQKAVSRYIVNSNKNLCGVSVNRGGHVHASDRFKGVPYYNL